ncbi:hypothetical protein, partial [Heyndrickxia coagulans]|uniref:hypothetical protein n=1 Tax=Heyndrickxia coagulans TaxID=1398 RepID=UPI001F3DD183
RLVTKPCQNIRPASSNYLNYYIFSRIFGGGIVKLSRKIFTPQSCANFFKSDKLGLFPNHGIIQIEELVHLHTSFTHFLR